MFSNRTASGLYWKVAPTGGALFATQNHAGGGPCPETARRIIITSDGDLYLIPVGGAAGAGLLFGEFLAGQVIDQQCDGIGSGGSAGVTVQF